MRVRVKGEGAGAGRKGRRGRHELGKRVLLRARAKVVVGLGHRWPACGGGVVLRGGWQPTLRARQGRLICTSIP